MKIIKHSPIGILLNLKKRRFIDEQNEYGMAICPTCDDKLTVSTTLGDKKENILKFYCFCENCERHYLYYYIKFGLVIEELLGEQLTEFKNAQKI